MEISHFALMSIILAGICFSFGTPKCIRDKGLRSFTCTEMRRWYPTLDRMCKDYGQVCCKTCNTDVVVTTTEAPTCTDTGFLGRDCRVMQTWYSSFEDFCAKSQKYCCRTCSTKKIACEDFDFAGINCGKLLAFQRNNKRRFCLKFGRYCCKTCLS